MRKLSRYRRIFRYIIRELRSEIRSVVHNPRFRRFSSRMMNISVGTILVTVSIILALENARGPAPEDCSALLIAIPMGIAHIFKS